jgi:hypothetical protein
VCQIPEVGSTLLESGWILLLKQKNVQLGLTLDGVNLFGDLNSCHSTWLVVLLNYNLVSNKMLLYDVGFNNLWQGICDIWKHKYVLGASH